MHRIVHIMVRDTSGRFLLQTRSETVEYLPWYWVASAAGHVQTGETYEEAAWRELEEEIGITSGELRELGKLLYEKGNGHRKYLTIFELITDAEINRGEEVSSTQFFTPDEVHNLIVTGDKIHPELKFLWGKLYAN
jgi:16S rRNA (adenine1518-N6/adenine1519-N6)-dimethyltransferase